jgi:hypothetical protein
MIPTSLTVIGKEYTVQMLTVAEFPDSYGETHTGKGTIKIQEGQTLYDEADTLLHETIHALDERFQMNLTERQVYCTTVGLLSLLRDNPDMLQYLATAVIKR